jgi:formylglycine-generating enzyme required for sulfatase activity
MGDEEYRAEDYVSAARIYAAATRLFAQSADQAREATALPEGLVERNGKFISVKDGAVMVRVPAGEFMMGSPAGEGDADERPRHLVRLDSFYMDAYEVTSAQFCGLLNEMGDQTEGGRLWLDIDNEACPIEFVDGQFLPVPGLASHPVTEVTFYGAQAYARWAGKRLPTEAEWEYACRAGTTTRYNTGDIITHNDANYDGLGGEDVWESTAPVGSFSPNAWGLYDMHGNVWEWCADKHHMQYYEVSPVDNPQGPDIGSQSVVRGGSWFGDPPYDLRSAYRNYHPPAGATFNLGFRCVKDVK